MKSRSTSLSSFALVRINPWSLEDSDRIFNAINSRGLCRVVSFSIKNISGEPFREKNSRNGRYEHLLIGQDAMIGVYIGNGKLYENLTVIAKELGKIYDPEPKETYRQFGGSKPINGLKLPAIHAPRNRRQANEEYEAWAETVYEKCGISLGPILRANGAI